MYVTVRYLSLCLPTRKTDLWLGWITLEQISNARVFMFTELYAVMQGLRAKSEKRWHLPTALFTYLYYLPYCIDTVLYAYGSRSRCTACNHNSRGSWLCSRIRTAVPQRPVRRTVLIFTFHFSLARPGVVGAPSDPLTSPGVRGVVGALGEP